MPDSINILVPKEAIDSIIQTDAAITKLDIVYRKMLTTIELGNKALKDSAITQENLSEAGKKVAKVSEELDAASKKLAASEKTLAEFDKEKYAQTLRNNQALKDQQGEVLKMVQAEKQLTGTIEKAEASTKALTAERKKLDLETVQGIARLKEINVQIDKNTDLIRTNGDAATKQRMNIGNYKSALEGLPGPLGNIATSANTAGTALKAVSKIPLLAVILAIIGALAGLFAAFKSTEEGGDRVQKIMGKLKGVLDVLKQAAQSVALAFADLLSGKFGQAADHLKEGFGGMGQRMKDAAKAGGDLAEALDNIADEKLAYNIDAVREKIAELRTEAAEATDPAERAAKLREAIALTEEMYGKQIDWSKRAADAEISNVTAKFKVSEEQLKAFLLADEAGRNKQIEGNAILGAMQNSLGKEGVAALRDKLTEETRLNTEFNKETLRLRKTASAGEEKDRNEAAAAYKQRVEDAKKLEKEKADAIKAAREDAALESTSFINKQRDEDLIGLNQLYMDGKISTEKYESEKNRITEYYADESLKNYLENLEIEIKAGGLTIGKELDMLAKAAELKKQITDKQANAKIDADKKANDEILKAQSEMDAEDEKAREKKKGKEEKDSSDAKALKEEIIQSTINLTSEAGNAIFEINNNRIEKEISDIERKRDIDIKAAGEDKDAQTKINAKYDKQVAEQKTKQAKNDRNAALFNIGINTAEAIMKAMTKDPSGILAIIAASIGAIQAGVVLSKPIPTFAHGTKGKYDTPSQFIAGEAGTEWLENKAGQIAEVTRPTMFTDAKGMRVYSNREIQRMDSLVTGGKGGFDSPELKEIRKGIDNMARSLANQKQYLMQNGKPIGYAQSGYTRKYLERMIG